MQLFDHYRVLIVDDDKSVADTLAFVLAMQRYETRVAHSAKQALEVTDEWKPDLAILDVILPGLNGIALAEFFKTRIPECRILLFSGQPGTADLLQQAEANGHSLEILAKPVHPEVLLKSVAKLLNPRVAA